MIVRYFHRRSIWLALAGALALAGSLFGVARQAHGNNPSGLLPNLVASPPDNAQFEVSKDEGGIAKGEGEAKLLLRFNGYVFNDGSGALDMRGSRSEPQVSQAAKEEVERRAEELKKGVEEPQEFSEQTERELAAPAMSVSQRLYATNEGAPQGEPGTNPKYDEENEKYLERQHEEIASSADMFYVNADGHHHWHLQHVAKYSLWNAAQTAEVAPSQKVGFCLEDSEHIEYTGARPGFESPESSVYSDFVAPYRDFCQRYLPNTTSVYEGISPGWRDSYEFWLGFQWIDVSNVLPGEYWLREEVNPEHKIFEEGTGEKVAYADEPTIVSGFDALPKEVSTLVNEPIAIVTESKAWDDKDPPDYKIVSGPQHGALEPIGGIGQFVYRPEAGFTGTDSFTFSAADPSSEFPRNPAIATVTIKVGAPAAGTAPPASTAPAPAVAISGAPAEMIAGTSVQLTARVVDGSPSVTWSATAGAITPGGLYTAPSSPPSGGGVSIVAHSSKGAEAQAMIKIRPVPASSSAPAAKRAKGCKLTRTNVLCRPEVMLIGHELVMTTRVGEAGRVRLSAHLGHRLLGVCASKTSGDRSFTCRLKLSKKVRLNAKISALASLRVGHKTFRDARPAAPVPRMKMSSGRPVKRTMRVLGRAASAWRFWCSPSMQM